MGKFSITSRYDITRSTQYHTRFLDFMKNRNRQTQNSTYPFGLTSRDAYHFSVAHC